MRATSRLNARNSRRQPGSRRALRLALCALAVCTIAAQPALAADDDEEDTQSFSQKIIGSVIRGIGGTNIENSGIDYRERSPLVIPPKVELRAPETQRQITAPNWPKDPDVAERQARKEAARKRGGATRDALVESREASRILLPSELAGQPVSRGGGSRDSIIPGATGYSNPILSPSELGYSGGFFGLFSSKKAEAERFTGEPSRESLTQPPVGYQTPSPNFAYGSGASALQPNYQPPTNPALDTGRR